MESTVQFNYVQFSSVKFWWVQLCSIQFCSSAQFSSVVLFTVHTSDHSPQLSLQFSSVHSSCSIQFNLVPVQFCSVLYSSVQLCSLFFLLFSFSKPTFRARACKDTGYDYTWLRSFRFRSEKSSFILKYLSPQTDKVRYYGGNDESSIRKQTNTKIFGSGSGIQVNCVKL